MASKAEAIKYVQKFLLSDMNHMGRLLCFRTDNDGEFTGQSYVDFCDYAGIRREYTAPGTAQYNVAVETANRPVRTVMRLYSAAYSRDRFRWRPYNKRQQQPPVPGGGALRWRL